MYCSVPMWSLALQLCLVFGFQRMASSWWFGYPPNPPAQWPWWPRWPNSMANSGCKSYHCTVLIALQLLTLSALLCTFCTALLCAVSCALCELQALLPALHCNALLLGASAAAGPHCVMCWLHCKHLLWTLFLGFSALNYNTPRGLSCSRPPLWKVLPLHQGRSHPLMRKDDGTWKY